MCSSDLHCVNAINFDSDSFDSDETFISEIKMFSFSSSDNLKSQIEEVKLQLSRLEPSQLTVKIRLKDKLQILQSQLPSK